MYSKATATSVLAGFACLLAVLSTTLIIPGTVFATGAKVQVCHIPPDDPDNFHTIKIGEKALDAHLSHLDLAGACDESCTALCDDGNACTIDDTADCVDFG